jgi:inorganic pyrophosphatase
MIYDGPKFNAPSKFLIPLMSQALVPVESDSTSSSRRTSFSIRDGIRVDPAELEYQAYVDQLFASIGPVVRLTGSAQYERCLMMSHPWHGVGIGDQYPDVVNAIIEIPAYSRVKTELDLDSGLLKVDRILGSSVIYPANYGFIPETFSSGNSPLDVLVLCQLSVPPLSLIKCKPIGIMPLFFQGQADEKIIAVAATDPEYNQYNDISELPPFKVLMIVQFFNDYRAMGKADVKGVVKSSKPLGAEEAKRIVCQDRTEYHRYFDVEDE